ncbi:MAG: GAF domain-containing protein, partial [Anaerolineae bacterium]|nr:GAF domain-containing protein [Anaerolineae bacterium]
TMTMWERLKRWFALPEIEGDEETRRTASLLNVILWAEMGVVLASSPLILLTNVQAAIVPVVVLLVLVGAMLYLLRAGRVRLAGNLFLINLWLVATGLLFVTGGLNHQSPSSYFVVVLVAGLLFGWRSIVWLIVASGLVISAVFVIERMGTVIPTPLVASPVFDISIMLSNLIMAAVLLSLTMRGLRDALTRARQSSADLEQQRQRLQQLVEERSRELARRTGYLGAATAVAQEAQLASGDLARLLPRVVQVISEQFGFYHTGFFLLDASKEWMVLQAASSEGGQRMLARQHRLEVGSQSIVGYVAARGERRIALDVGQDAVFFDNPDLPETRSEMAVPLRVGGEILGVLDVQSTERQAFTDEDVTTLQAVADQVAMAVSNARLLQQVEASAEAERRAMGDLSREAWLNLLQSRQDLGFYDDGTAIAPAGEVWRPEMEIALQGGQQALNEDGSTLALPLRVREQVIGVIDGRKSDGTAWSAEEIGLLQTLTEQLSTALEGAQLYLDSQRRAAREQIIGQVTGRIRETLDMEAMLRTAAEQMRQALDLDDLVVRLAVPERKD